jgi:hypothetical protein
VTTDELNTAKYEHIVYIKFTTVNNVEHNICKMNFVLTYSTTQFYLISFNGIYISIILGIVFVL